MRSYENPTLTIIVACYNNASYISACLDSILCQSYKDYELIVVNDGSTDASREILGEYENRDKKITIIDRVNGGLSAARNTGLDHATGRFVCFVDGDDSLGNLEGGAGLELSDMVSELESDIDLLVGEVSVIYEADQHMEVSDTAYYSLRYEGKRDIKDVDLNSFHVSAWTKFYRRELIEKYHLRFPEGLYFEDAYWHWCYCAIAGMIKFVHKPFYRYYRHPSGIMHNTFNAFDCKRSVQHIYIGEKIIEFYRQNGLEEKSQRALQDALTCYFWFAFRYSSPEDQFFIAYETGKVLRRLNFNCEGATALQSLKSRNFVPELNLTPSQHLVLEFAHRFNDLTASSSLVYLAKRFVYGVKKASD